MLMTAAGSATCFWLPRRQPEQCKTERGSGFPVMLKAVLGGGGKVENSNIYL